MIGGKVQGLKELERALLALPREIVGKNGGPLRTALRVPARMMRDEAQDLAPQQYGRLAGAITVRVDKNPGNVSERLIVKPRKGSSRDDPRGAWYWFLVEFGSIGGKAPDQQPQPYMRPAFDARKDAGLLGFKLSLGRSINAIARKLSRNGSGR